MPGIAQGNARTYVLVILVLWFLSTYDSSAAVVSPDLSNARLQRQKDALRVLNARQWGDFAPRSANDSAPGEQQPADQDVDGSPAHDPSAGIGPERGSYLNLTGFRESDGLAWQDLGRFRTRCREWTQHAHPGDTVGPTWQNVTGVVAGKWARRAGSVVKQESSYNLTHISPDVGWTNAAHEWGRNVTGSYGTIHVQLIDHDAVFPTPDDTAEQAGLASHHEALLGGLGIVRAASATVLIQDDATGSSAWRMRLHGIHWPSQGTLLMTTTSDKFSGIFGLPHLAPEPRYFNSSQAMLNETLAQFIRSKEEQENDGEVVKNPWSSDGQAQPEAFNPSPRCEYILYLQVYPFEHSLDRTTSLRDLEDELRNPIGRPVGRAPKLQVSSILWSPDCAFFLESKGPPNYVPSDGLHLTGQREEVYKHETSVWLLIFSTIMFAQMNLLKKQMRESNTPSTLGRVSFCTMGTMLLADGLVFAGASACSLDAAVTFLPFVFLTFAACMSTIVAGAFLSEIYKIQEPERRNREREREQARAQRNANNNNSNNSTNDPRTNSSQLPSAAARPLSHAPPRPPRTAPVDETTPIMIPPDHDIDAEIAEQNNATTSTANTTTNANNHNSDSVASVPFSTIVTRFMIVGSILLFLSLASLSWPTRIRAYYTHTLLFIYLSLWLPQIWRNMQRNSRRAFSWHFTIGQSVLRLLPIAYFYLRPENVLFVHPDPPVFVALAAWVWLQLWILAAQDVVGPRFAVPRCWAKKLPPAWDYHPVLREGSLEDGGGSLLPIGLDRSSTTPMRTAKDDSYGTDRPQALTGSTSAGTSSSSQLRSVECAVCQEMIEVSVVCVATADDRDRGGGGGDGGDESAATTAPLAGMLARRAYMVTPCRHIFHTPCLEGWLRFRLQCPICRKELPPL